MICACGCGEDFTPARRGQAGAAVRYKYGHAQRVNPPRKGVRRSIRQRIAPGGQYCSCGCGRWIEEFYPSGLARYSRAAGGAFYALRTCSPLSNGKRIFEKAKRIINGGYAYLYAPEHPSAHQKGRRKGYAPEHRIIWEQTNGRSLSPDEIVHHINGDGLDNRPENLVALMQSAHKKLHLQEKPLTREQHQKAGLAGALARWHKHLRASASSEADK